MEAIDTLYAMENVDKKGNISKKKAKKVFDALDVNGDGNLSLEEFVSGCLADTDLVREQEEASLIGKNFLEFLRRFVIVTASDLAAAVRTVVMRS